MRKAIALIGILLSMNVLAQQYQTFEGGGETMLLLELRAMLEEKDGGIAVAMAMAAERRTEPYRNLDIQKGDLVPFINKKRVRTIAAFNEVYESLAIGDTVMLGIKRGDGDMFILRFPKIDPDKSGLKIQRVETVGGTGAGSTRVMPAEGMILGEADQQVIVANVLVGSKEAMGVDLKKGDVLTAINGHEVVNLAMVDKVYEALKVGDEVEIDFLRGDESFKATFKKPAPREGVFMMKR